jgi:hypothetical protein
VLLGSRLQQRRHLAARLALGLGIAGIAELGEQAHHGRGAGACARCQGGGRFQQRMRVVAAQGLGQRLLAGRQFRALLRQALRQQQRGFLQW